MHSLIRPFSATAPSGRRTVLRLLPAVLLAGLVGVAGPLSPASAAGGGLDPGFGVRGVFRPPAGTCCTTPGAEWLALGGSGRIWAAGFRGSVYLDRVTGTGTQDPTFRQGHPYGFDTGDGALTIGAVPLTDGGALVGWSLFSATTVDTGVVDRFGATGLRAAEYRLPAPPLPTDATDGPHYRHGLVRTATGAIRVAAAVGTATGGVVSLTGLTATGAPDPAVGPGGVRTVPGLVDVQWLQQDGSGRLYLVGLSPARTLRVVRTDPNGRVDPAYGTAGSITFGGVLPDTAGHGEDVKAGLTRAGTLYVATTVRDTAGLRQVALAKATSAGLPGAGFGTAGVRRYGRAGGSTELTAIGLVTGGRLVLGVLTTGGDPALAGPALLRIAVADGTPDPTFGAVGWYRTVERNLFLVVDSAGRMLVTGYKQDAAGRVIPVLVRRLA